MQIHIFDFIVSGWLFLFAINGYFTGFWKGIFSIIKWTFIIIIFYFGYPIAEKFWERFMFGELTAIALSALTLFIISLIFVSWISEAIESRIYKNILIKYINKIFGLILGISKGAAILIGLFYIMIYFEIKSEWIKESNSGKKINYISNKFIKNNDTFISFIKNIENVAIKNHIQKIKIVS